MSPIRLLLGLLVSGLLASALPAYAQTEYCVGSASALRSALTDAALDGTDSLIQIRSGSIALTQDARYEPGSEFVIPAGRLTVRGGYNADCSSYSLTAGATVLSSTNGSRLAIRTLTGDAAVNGLTFQGAHLQMVSTAGSPCPGSRRQFSLSRVRVNGAGMAATAWCHNVKITNSLFTAPVAVPATGHAGDSAVAIDLAYNADGFGSASRLTMVNSTISGGRLSLNATNATVRGNAYLYNSIFSRSAGDDISSESNIYARNNRFDGIDFSNGAVLLNDSGANVSAGAQLDAQFVPVPGSPMVNTGTSVVPDGLTDVDHTGNDRVIGARPDIGALESPVDGSGIYVVTNANASGTGSLVWALGLANSDDGFNQIRFNIPGGCPKRITPGASLQVRQSVHIDGQSQPGSAPNTSETGTWNGAPCIVLNGGAARGIGIETTGPLGASSGYLNARGLAFENYDVAISLAFGTAHRIQGNQFGGLVPASNGGSAITLDGNTQAIAIVGGTNTTIGGTGAAARNLISDSSDIGVWITQFLGGGGSGNSVVNNLIGFDRNGGTALPNGTGIVINGADNAIVGNRIGGNNVDGIRLAGSNATDNRITGNFIGGGTGSLSFTAGNDRMGVMIENGAWHNEIGPDNTIGRNGDDGVRVYTNAGGGNRINGNSIALNAALGIDLGSNGVSDNDPDPAACAVPGGCDANRGQNFPSLSQALRVREGAIPIGTPVRIKGTLRSVPGSGYHIEVFGGDACEANLHGEGKRLLGTVEMSIPNVPYCPIPGGACLPCSSGNCTAGFSVWVPELDVQPGDAITATATNLFGDTSEFSACKILLDEDEVNDLIFADGFDP